MHTKKLVGLICVYMSILIIGIIEVALVDYYKHHKDYDHDTCYNLWSYVFAASIFDIILPIVSLYWLALIVWFKIEEDNYYKWFGCFFDYLIKFCSFCFQFIIFVAEVSMANDACDDFWSKNALGISIFYYIHFAVGIIAFIMIIIFSLGCVCHGIDDACGDDDN
jgi:hypothetical protein